MLGDAVNAMRGTEVLNATAVASRAWDHRQFLLLVSDFCFYLLSDRLALSTIGGVVVLQGGIGAWGGREGLSV